jgi:L-ascorbate metabolism protein UlaG (beta-lactamase superfamily)
MKLVYHGHACFSIEADGTSILIDPFNDTCGYPMPDVTPAAVVVSHEHFDHNYVQVAKGAPKVIRGLKDGGKDWAQVNEKVGPVAITTVRTYHDPSEGSQRGKNAMVVFESGGIRLVHTGDLGHPLSSEHVKALGRVDVLLVAVGGFYTIGPREADEVIGQLNPKVVIPMHYKTPVNESWPIGPLDEFLKGKSRVKRIGGSTSFTEAALPKDQETWVLSAG